MDREKKELEDMVKQKEKQLLRLQQVYLTKYLTIYFNQIILYLYRYLPPKVLNSEKPLCLSWESNWLSTQMDKCMLLQCMTSVLLLFSNPHQKTKVLGCNLWLVMSKGLGQFCSNFSLKFFINIKTLLYPFILIIWA